MTQEALVRAMAARQLVEFTYHGKRRVVEPHDLGIHRGVTQLLAYQVRGGSESGGIPEWRRFNVDEIESVVLCDCSFPAPREAWLRDKPQWDQSIATVQ